MFLDDLIQRAMGEAPVVGPRRASRFEPAQGAAELPPEEAAELPSAPRPRVAPPPPDAPAELRPAQRIQASPGERSPQAREPAPRDPATLVERRIEPMPAAALAPSKPRAASLEGPPRGEPDAPQPVVPAPVGGEPAREALPGTPRETLVRERVESRLETRATERRLESMEQQTRVERVERIREPSAAAIQPAPRERPAERPPPPAAHPRPAVVVPELRRAPPAAPPPEPAAAPAATPVVHVTIGRVEVRAAPPAPARPPARGREPRLNLEDYLQRREKA